MSKQSSIEWLIECLNIHLTEEQKTQFEGLFQQAKQMHKEEIVDGYANGHNDGCRYMDNLKQDFEHGEQYYQETYGGQDA